MSSPPTQNGPQSGRRSTSRSSSFGFLRRTKSTEPLGERRSSGSRLSRKKKAELERAESRRQQEVHAAKSQGYNLPVYTPQPQLQTFGGDNRGALGSSRPVDNKMTSKASVDIPNRGRSANVPIPPVPGSSSPVDPYARTESMTHRGRYSYASSIVSSQNNPRRVRRRKDPTPYNVLVIGASNAGKTSFINFLRTSLALPAKKRPTRAPQDFFDTPPSSAKASRNFVHYYLETEIDGERVGLTIWDSQGLEKNVVDLQLRDISSFLESKFEDTFTEEMKVIRAPGVQDTHIHCVFFVLDPVRLDSNIQAAQLNPANGHVQSKYSKSPRIVGGLDEDFDLQVLRTLQGKTTVVPVISKADTVTTAHMAFLKKTVWGSLKKAGLDPLEALKFEPDDEEEKENKLDEREEDEAIAKRYKDDGVGSDERPDTPHTDDSDTIPFEQPTPTVKRRASHKRNSSTMSIDSSNESQYLPLSILSPDSYSLGQIETPVGRRFPWGFADPYNPEHCDFVKLKESCFGEWRADLREASKEIFYERWRTSRLNRQDTGANAVGSTAAARKSSSGLPAGILKDKRR